MNVLERIERGEVFVTVYDKTRGEKSGQLARELINKAKRAARQWIPVSERLPEDGQVAWITFINEAGKHTGEATFKKDKFYYVTDTVNGYYEEVYSCVTHWMPIPEPPKEGGE